LLYNTQEGCIIGIIYVPLKYFDMKDNKDKSTKIELDSFLVSVCKDKDLQPFSNTFRFEGENPAQHKLGEFFGVIKIKDHSEESAYLPNLLSQVAKREFFLKPNRGTEESFESALSKVNLALADLAEHDVTNWIDNLDAAIGVINNKDFHFTKLGKGQIFLSKNKQIINISNGLNENINVHPVKTFSDISSGSLSIDDKVIFSTKTLFKSLSWEEIARHTKTFTSNEFDNILKSTLDIEGEDVGAVIVNIQEKSVMPIPARREKSTQGLNFFGESEIFSSRTSLGKRCHSLRNKDIEQEKTQIETAPTDATKNVFISSLIPKKTQSGEIKLSAEKKLGDEAIMEQEAPGESTRLTGNFPISPFEEHPELFIKETDEERIDIEKVDTETEIKLNSVLDKVKQTLEELKKKSSLTPSSIPLVSRLKIGKDASGNIKEFSFDESLSYPPELPDEIYSAEKMESEKRKVHEEKELLQIKNAKIRKQEEQNFKKFQTKFHTSRNTIKSKLKSLDFQKISYHFKILFTKMIGKCMIIFGKISPKIKSLSSKSKKEFMKLFTRIKEILAEKKSQTYHEYQAKKSEGHLSFEKESLRKKGFLKENFNKTLSSVKKILKTTNLPQIMVKVFIFSKNNKKFVITCMIIFVIITLILSFLLGSKEKNTGEVLIFGELQTGKQDTPIQEQVEATVIADLESEIQYLTGDKDELFIYTTSEKFFRIDITNNNLQEIPLKNNIKDIEFLVSMPTLRLIFLISERDVFSYSPVMNNLSDVDIKLPGNLEIGGAGVYLQYLYLLDRNSKNIYQFPRKPGGFLDYKTRIANQDFLSTSVDLAVDDSLLAASENGEIQQYFEGKLKNTFSVKTNGYPDLQIVDIETKPGPSNIYALDAKNGIITKIQQENPTNKQKFFNKNFIEAQNIWINDKQDRAFISAKNGQILRISL
jgi:hypothetical protein